MIVIHGVNNLKKGQNIFSESVMLMSVIDAVHSCLSASISKDCHKLLTLSFHWYLAGHHFPFCRCSECLEITHTALELNLHMEHFYGPSSKNLTEQWSQFL
jgi:hypothetical protein